MRDLAGLIVIDFIDMLEERNVRLVEKKLKDCLKNDRARIQVGHISHFGLLEMSRQRIRISVLESTTQPCPHCAGTGSIRSESSIALHVMRSIEEYLLHNSQYNIIVRTPVATALYVLNHKRNILVNLEARFKLNISIEADDSIGTQHLVISKGTIAESISQSSLEDDNKQEIEDSVFIKSESIENPPLTETNQKRQRKNRHDEATDHSLSTVHKKEDALNDDSYRRGRRRGRRGGRRNQDNSFFQIRVPYAEPVGDFAKQALAEIKAAHRKRRVPSAKSSKLEEIKDDTQILDVQQQDEATKVDTNIKSKKRKTRPSKAVENNLSLENNQNVAEQKSLEEKPKNSSVRKVKTKKADKSVHEVEDKTPENGKKSTRRTRKKSSSKETPEIQKTFEEASVTEMGEVIKSSPSQIEKTINQPVVISSESNDAPKTARIGWWKRRTLSKN